jgi:hypothetical protein
VELNLKREKKVKLHKTLNDFVKLVLGLHYKGISPERIVEIVKEKENYDLSINDVKRILSWHEKGYVE